MNPKSLIPAWLAATLFLAAAAPAIAEAPKSGADRKAERLERLDQNGDGKLDEAERARGKKHAERLRKAMLKKHDADKDGRLNDAERAAAVEDMLSRPRVVQRFDQDGDGKLNEAEKAAAKEQLRNRGE
jgi:hypothetical protein